MKWLFYSVITAAMLLAAIITTVRIRGRSTGTGGPTPA